MRLELGSHARADDKSSGPSEHDDGALERHILLIGDRQALERNRLAHFVDDKRLAG